MRVAARCRRLGVRRLAHQQRVQSRWVSQLAKSARSEGLLWDRSQEIRCPQRWRTCQVVLAAIYATPSCWRLSPGTGPVSLVGDCMAYRRLAALFSVSGHEGRPLPLVEGSKGADSWVVG